MPCGPPPLNHLKVPWYSVEDQRFFRLQHLLNVGSMVRKKVLQDHKQRGKTLIPPVTHMLGPLREVSWVKTILPELLWVALIQDRYGHHMGV